MKYIQMKAPIIRTVPDTSIMNPGTDLINFILKIRLAYLKQFQ
jgi:hypothetical protein